MNRSFKRYEQSFKKMVDDGVTGLAAERECLEAATRSTVSEVDRLDARLEDRALSVVTVVLTVAIIAVAVVVVAGGLWMGSSLLGVTVAIPELWERAWAAGSWWAGLGWAVGAVALMVGTVAAVARAVVWVRQRWPDGR